jgi:hypothetical protein
MTPLGKQVYGNGGLPVTDEYLADFLEALPGKAFCHRCLTTMIREPIDSIRDLTERLTVVDGFTMKVAACSGCDQQNAVFGYGPAP